MGFPGGAKLYSYSRQEFDMPCKVKFLMGRLFQHNEINFNTMVVYLCVYTCSFCAKQHAFSRFSG